MKAAILKDWRTIAVEEVDPPELGESDALIRVSLSGVCGSDVHIFSGHNPIAIRPVIQGHEFMGTLEACNGVLPHGISIGDRVVVHPLVSCGTCRPCRTGIDHVCEKLVVLGVNRNGAFAEFVSVPANKLIAVPDSIPDAVAVLTEPFSVGFHCLQRAGLQPGETVLVVGGGPIGHYAALVARQLGAEPVVISEPLADRRALIERFALKTVDPSRPESLSEVRALTGGHGFDVVVETSGVDAGIQFALEAACVQGRIAALGFPAEQTATYNVTRTITKELSFIGSRVYPLAEFRQTVAMLETMHQTGSVNFDDIVSDPRGLDSLVRSIEQMAAGKAINKILIEPA